MEEIDWSKAPKGATHYSVCPDAGSKWLRADGSNTAWWDAYDAKWVSYTIEHYAAKHAAGAIPRPATPWNGEGLPPVGTVCEIAASTEYLKVGYPEGTKVKIYANFTDDRGVELAAFVDEIGKVGGIAIAKCFRPIRTPEQIAAEERKLAIDAMQRIVSSGDPHYGRKVCEALYDAGCRLPADA